jgi:Asp-tRNA(Asn)/Glu-tRNA(Gln) amidotransferase A subunit family amidase
LERLLQNRQRLAAHVDGLSARFDAIVCPVSAVPALPHGTASKLILAAAPCLLANLLDLAAGAVPVTRVAAGEEPRCEGRDPVIRAGRDADRGSRGLPIGVQVIALRGGESTVLAVMRAIEAGAGFSPQAAG